MPGTQPNSSSVSRKTPAKRKKASTARKPASKPEAPVPKLTDKSIKMLKELVAKPVRARPLTPVATPPRIVPLRQLMINRSLIGKYDNIHNAICRNCSEEHRGLRYRDDDVVILEASAANERLAYAARNFISVRHINNEVFVFKTEHTGSVYSLEVKSGVCLLRNGYVNVHNAKLSTQCNLSELVFILTRLESGFTRNSVLVEELVELADICEGIRYAIVRGLDGQWNGRANVRYSFPQINPHYMRSITILIKLRAGKLIALTPDQLAQQLRTTTARNYTSCFGDEVRIHHQYCKMTTICKRASNSERYDVVFENDPF